MTVATKKPIKLSLTSRKFVFSPFYRPRYTGKELMYDPNMPTNIIVVGCGGNGGYMVPLLARYIVTSPSELIRGIEITLIDGDRIEEKNILRQNFVQAELGMNKAEAIAERCNRNLGTNIKAVTEYGTESLLGPLIRHQNGTTLVFGCVDRHEVRNVLCDLAKENANVTYVDVGNELEAGQLFVTGRVQNAYSSTRSKDTEDEDFDPYNNRTPFNPKFAPIVMSEFYPEIAKTDKKKASPSCDVMTASGRQRMDVNVKASTLMFEAFCGLMTPDGLPYYEITFGPGVTRTSFIDDLDLVKKNSTSGSNSSSYGRIYDHTKAFVRK